MLYGKKPNATDKFFPVPNMIFNLGLDGGEILVYFFREACATFCANGRKKHSPSGSSRSRPIPNCRLIPARHTHSSNDCLKKQDFQISASMICVTPSQRTQLQTESIPRPWQVFSATPKRASRSTPTLT